MLGGVIEYIQNAASLSRRQNIDIRKLDIGLFRYCLQNTLNMAEETAYCLFAQT